MNWNEYRTDYVKKHGSTSVEELSKSYAKYKKSSQKSPRKSPSRKSPAKKSPRKSPQKSPNFEKIRASMPATRKYKIQQLEKVMKNRNEGKGSPTRGWQAESVQTTTERKELLEHCGEKAYLLPKEKKFPVMPALRVSKDCQYSCEGISSSKNRACQYGYLDVAEKAQKLGEKHCNFPHQDQPCRTKRKAPGPPM